MKPGRFICTECNAIYEEPDKKSDPKKKPFDLLEADWHCECGATKDKYKPCSCVSVEPPEHKHEERCGHANSV